MKMNKKWWCVSLISFVLPYMSYGDAVSLEHVNPQHIEQHKMTIQSSAKKYHYVRSILRTGAAASVLYVVFSLVREQSIPLARIRELAKECPCIQEHLKNEVPEVVSVPQTSGFFSRVYSGAKSLATGSAQLGAYLVQHLLAFRLFEMLNVKMETLFRYPGTIDWFVESQTDLTTLLDQYQEKAELLLQADTHFKSELKRAKEFISSQWRYVVRDIEHILAYINYIQDTTAIDIQECETIVSYITKCTDEVADTISAHLYDSDSTSVCSKIKQFKVELASLLSRFERLYKRRSL